MSSSSSPCAACKCLRRKCTHECAFAPYFPADQPQKFANVHKVFGASNVAKLLNELNVSQREDAVNSLAYEAEFRLRDPVYGCVGLISVLKHKLEQVQADLNNAKKELATFIGPSAMLLQPPPSAAYNMSPTMLGLHPSAVAGPSHAGGGGPLMLQTHPHQQPHMLDAQQMAAMMAAREQQEMMRRYEQQQQQQQQQQHEFLRFGGGGFDPSAGASADSGFNQMNVPASPSLALAPYESLYQIQNQQAAGTAPAKVPEHHGHAHHHHMQFQSQLVLQQPQQQPQAGATTTPTHHQQQRSGSEEGKSGGVGPSC